MKKINLALALMALTILGACTSKEEPKRPNIVWIMLEDWGYQLSCYDEPGVSTPNIDGVAQDGIRFTNSFCTAPVCSPSRSAMITGFHQNYIDAHQHRTNGSGFERKPLPNGIQPISHLLEESGYFTCLMGARKTDFNFTLDKPAFQGEDWSEREDGQPFFAQITFAGTHRRWKRDRQDTISVEEVRLPPYYPQTQLAKRDWANGLEAMQIVDRQVGSILQRLEEEGLADQTAVFIIGDNGRCMPRGKQFLYDGGIQVPIIARWPGKVESGLVNDDMVSTLDITKTILDLAGVKTPYELHGSNLFDGSTKDREYIFAARDKMDSTHDAMRAIRSKQFKLIHNLMPERAYCQYNNYKERSYPVLAELNVLNLRGDLSDEQALFMAECKPEFELFNLASDPWELNNLADDPEYQEVKHELLKKLTDWRENTIHDRGVSEIFRNGGWPSNYPTKSLEEWQATLEKFKPWVFRKPGETLEHPFYPSKK